MTAISELIYFEIELTIPNPLVLPTKQNLFNALFLYTGIIIVTKSVMLRQPSV